MDRKDEKMAVMPVKKLMLSMGIKDGIKYGVLYTSIIMLIGTVVVEIFAQPFAKVLMRKVNKAVLYTNRMNNMFFKGAEM